MIIKEADNKRPQIEILQELLKHPDATPDTKQKIEQEIRNIRAGLKGEAEAAYEIDFHYGQSKNWAIIHDLRIECDGRIAQIDHIAINRLLEIYVCESKHFSEGIAINEHGECTAFYNSKPYAVLSPFEQNKKHIIVLESLFQTGAVRLPTRLGFQLSPKMCSLVMVSNKARISRPKVKTADMDSLIKNEMFKAKLDKLLESENNPMQLAKLIGSDKLELFARDIAEMHTPIQFNWAGKFGLSKPVAPDPVVKPTVKTVPEPESADEPVKPKQKLICATCSQPVTYNVAKFCWGNKQRFGGNIYCIDCQKNT